MSDYNKIDIDPVHLIDEPDKSLDTTNLTEQPTTVDFVSIMIEPEDEVLSILYNIDSLITKTNTSGVILFVSNKNVEFYTNKINKIHTDIIHKITIVNLSEHLDNLDYDMIMTNKKFYEFIPTDTFLIFQKDALILNGSLLGQFMDYDIVIAPQRHDVLNVLRGVSLRKKSKLLEMLEAEEFVSEIHLYEIEFFMSSAVKYTIPETLEKAKQFSIENVYSESAFCACAIIDQSFSYTLRAQNPNFKILNILLLHSGDEIEKVKKEIDLPLEIVDEKIRTFFGKNYYQ